VDLNVNNYEERRKESETATEKEMLRLKNIRQKKPTHYKKHLIVYIRVRSIRPNIWRRVRIPAFLSLEILHDKVLCPVIGWKRNYHTYLFVRPNRVNRLLGYAPSDTRAVDRMHFSAKPGGKQLVDAAKVYIGDLLLKQGDVIRYTYDLGDTWTHEIRLEEIVPPAKPVCEVLAGALAGPVEDIGSAWKYVQTVNKFLDPKHPKNF